ncbi:MAG: serine/threonine protein kinase [Gemmatimonadota bacterium]|nr:serine/threonine protein kinase [Gemmatimonadota bacterium]
MSDTRQLLLSRRPDGDETSRQRSVSAGLPPALVRRAVRRIRFVALLVLVMMFFGWFLTNLIEGDLPSEFTRPMQWGPNILIVVASLMMVMVVGRWGTSTPQRVITLGLVYEVVVSFGGAFGQYWDSLSGLPLWVMNSDIVGIAPIALWIIFFTVLVPARPRQALAALIAAASAVPISYLIMVQFNNAPSLDALNFVFIFVGPYVVVVLLAYLASRIIYRLGQDVTRAQEMGSYRLEERLGGGGMGEVWRASHRMLARPAAIKLIRPETLREGNESAEAATSRFEREAQVTARLQSPHTIDLYDFGTSDDGAFYYVMELLEGRDLDYVVRKFGPLLPERVIYILRQACWSLAEAHRGELIHRDIKPANVYLCRRAFQYDFVKVLDFGLVKYYSSAEVEQQLALSRTGVVAGTPSFMAPEMVMGDRAIDGRADIYALGCVAYWMLTGVLVFEATSVGAMMVAHAQRTPVPPSDRTELAISADLEALVLRCLAKDPKDRPQTAEQLERELGTLATPDPWTPARAARWWEQHDPQAFASNREVMTG